MSNKARESTALFLGIIISKLESEPLWSNRYIERTSGIAVDSPYCQLCQKYTQIKHVVEGTHAAVT